MPSCPYAVLMRCRRWATNNLYDVIAENLGRVVEADKVLILRLLDHIQTVEEMFSYNLEGDFHGHLEPKSIELPSFESVRGKSRVIGDWYVTYVDTLTPSRRDEDVDFTFSDGSPAVMTRGEMLLHVATHSAYHRGNVGLLLQKNCIQPNPDRLTDFLEFERTRSQRDARRPFDRPMPSVRTVHPAP